jgi:fibronectin type 3 domain-containing protein
MTRRAVLLFLVLLPAARAQGSMKSLATNVTSTGYTDTTCPDGSTCYYAVTAVNSSGAESLPSNVAKAVMPASGSHSASLNWNTSAGANSYKVYVFTSGNARPWTRDGRCFLPSAANGKNYENSKNGRSYP